MRSDLTPIERHAMSLSSSDRAESFFKRLGSHIEALQGSLKQDEQLLIYYYSPNTSILVGRIEYKSPDLMILYGYDQHENLCRVYTHTAAIQLTVMVQKVEKGKPKRRIGFVSDEQNPINKA